MAEITYHITVKGDCGRIHPSFEDWQACSVCDAILRSRVNHGFAKVRREMDAALYPHAGARDEAIERIDQLTSL